MCVCHVGYAKQMGDDQSAVHAGGVGLDEDDGHRVEGDCRPGAAACSWNDLTGTYCAKLGQDEDGSQTRDACWDSMGSPLQYGPSSRSAGKSYSAPTLGTATVVRDEPPSRMHLRTPT